MSKIRHGNNAPEEDSRPALHIAGHGDVFLPAPHLLKDAVLLKDGDALILKNPDGSLIVIEDYFNADSAPLLHSASGEILTPAMVVSFLQPEDDAQFAAAGTMNDESAVGTISEVTGTATITRVSGLKEAITPGMAVFEGDVVETEGEGAVNIQFVDETSFAVSQNARLSIDEYVFDPASESGRSDFSILRGLFVFTSGLIGREDPDDVKIHTPMGSIGIRGTIIAGNATTGEITVLEGAIVLYGTAGEEITLSHQYETAQFNPSAENGISYIGTLPLETFSANFASMRTIAPSLFTEITPQTGAEETAPAQNETQPETNSGAETSSYNDLDAGFDGSAAYATGTEQATQQTQSSVSTATADASSVQETASSPTASSEPAPFTPVSSSGGTATPAPFNPHHIFLADIIGAGATANGWFTAGGAGQRLGDRVFAAGDFDGNGSPDFFATTDMAAGGKIFAYNGTGTEISGGGITAAGSPTGKLSAAYLGDIDGDGAQDWAHGAPDSGTGFAGNTVALASGYGFIAFTGQDDSASDAGARGSSTLDKGDMLGHAIAGIGDINGDGFNDMMIGAPGRDLGASDDAGAAYVIMGGTSFASPINIDAIGGSNFMLGGAGSADFYAASLSGAGDMNNDGYADFMISKAGAGEVDVYFGAASAASIPGSVKTITGLSVAPGDSEIPLFNMGDMNGDGITDIAVAATGGTGAAYIFSGAAVASAGATINVASASTTVTPGIAGYALVGGGSAGDFNGDGFDDGAFAFQNGTQLEIYVLYGGLAGGNIDMNALNNGITAFHMSLDMSPYSVTNLADLDIDFANAGDLDGDAFDDLVIGMAGLNGGNGGVFVINGRNDSKLGADGQQTHIANDTSPNWKVFANGNNQHLVGDGTANELNDKLGTDAFGHVNISMRGGAGNDVFIINNLSSGADLRNAANLGNIDGGSDHDSLLFHGDGDTLDFASVGSEGLSSIEEFIMMGNNQTLVLGLDDLFRLLQQSGNGTLSISANGNTNNRLFIENNGNALMATGNVTASSLQTELDDAQDPSNPGSVSHTVAGGYDRFSFGGYTVEIESVLLDATNPSQIV